ncbi:MAG: hypothetical protein NVSMB44_30490 [Ktedonobacteraceae bacterium]
MDFYQVPNGAYAFLHGGKLDGTPMPGQHIFGVGFPINPNVYHPLFTLLLGRFLIVFTPYASFYVWMLMKLLITIPVLFYFYKKFKGSRYLDLAIFLTLINSTQYLEIEISQFQFVLNMFLFIMLINFTEYGDSIWNGICYFGTLLVKPVGFLWIPVLLFKQQYKTLIVGVGLFGVATGIFMINNVGGYFVNNLVAHFLYPFKSGPIQIITLDALLRYTFHPPELLLSVLKISFLALIIFMSAFKRIHFVTGVYLAVVYYLLFYDYVFEYHYTTLIPILAVGLVTRPEFQTLAAKICIIWISLPNIFFILHYFHFAMIVDPFLGPDPTPLGWQLIVVSRILPILILTGIIVWTYVRPIYADTKSFIAEFKKMNKELAIFG